MAPVTKTVLKSEIRNPKSEARSWRGNREPIRTSRFELLSDFGLRVLVLSAVWLLAIAHCLSAAEPADPQSASPFLRLREAALGYHGPEGNFTNLTEIRIGWFGPTNLDDPLTGDLWWAARFAIQEANAQTVDFGLRASDFSRLPIRLIPRWAVDPWGTGVSQLTRMVYDEQPLAILGSVDSATTHLAEQVVAKANLPLVSPIATDKSITLAGVSWMFSCAPSDDAIARMLVDDVLATLNENASSSTRSVRHKEAATDKSEIRNPKSEIDQSLLTSAATSQRSGLALLACTDHESRMTTREVLKEFSRRGRMPDFRFDVPPGAHAAARQMSALEEACPSVVLIIAGAEDSARLVRALRAGTPLGFGVRQSSGAMAAATDPEKAAEDCRTPRRSRADRDAPLSSCALFGSHAMGRARFRELAGPVAEGARFPLLFVPDRSDKNAALFVAHFTSERRHPPDYTAALTYDATRLLLEAIRRAGPNRARIREALTQLSPWPGIAGPIHFDGTGQNTRTNICMATIRDGAIDPLTGTRNPTQTASIHPTP